MTYPKTDSTKLREEAVKLLLTQGQILEDTALRLMIPKSMLTNWVDATWRDTSHKVTPGSRSVPELVAEVTRLRKELADTLMEHDIVKKRQRTLRRSRCEVRRAIRNHLRYSLARHSPECRSSIRQPMRASGLESTVSGNFKFISPSNIQRHARQTRKMPHQ
jgi:transposase